MDSLGASLRGNIHTGVAMKSQDEEEPSYGTKVTHNRPAVGLTVIEELDTFQQEWRRKGTPLRAYDPKG